MGFGYELKIVPVGRLKTVSEPFTLKDGYGSIGFEGDATNFMLHFHSKPYAIGWHYVLGGEAQYFLVRFRKIGYHKHVEAVRKILEVGFDGNQSLQRQLNPLLRSFRNGRYRLIYYEPNCRYVEDICWRPDSNYFRNTTNEKNILILTKVATDSALVRKYVNRIAGGKRPVVVTTAIEGSRCEFVIDGHHKLAAYRVVNIPPRVVRMEQALL